MAKTISHGSFDLKTTIFLWVTFFFVPSYSIIEGRRISREDYLEAKRLVQLSRRPSVKSIKVDDGDIFDCVLIEKQLAFEHPALRNHTIQMKPTSIPDWPLETEGSNDTSQYLGLKGEGCPIGSVPVRRVQIQDILSSPSVSSFGRKPVDVEKHRWAAVVKNGAFRGTKASVNLWNPKVDPSPAANQFSLSQFWAINTGDNLPSETIEAGWIVYPVIYGDVKTRFFTYWTSDGYDKTGCYNVVCPGFVQVNSRVPPGSTFSVMSSYDGPQFYIDLSIVQDTTTKDWWLFVQKESIGYWPHTLFNRLTSAGTSRVDWGGEVANINNLGKPYPPMGSGQFPLATNFYGKSCSTANMIYLDQDSKWNEYALDRVVQDTPNCYKVIDGGKQDAWGRVITFGGPGGQC